MFKKIGVFIAFVVLAGLTISTLTVSASSSLFSEPNFPIHLEVEICWDGEPCLIRRTQLNEDRTLETIYATKGEWSFTGAPDNEITLIYYEGCRATLTGTVSANYKMSGTMVCEDGSHTGTWRARLSSAYPAP